MANLNMGYPKRSGDTEKDLLYMYNYLCEMSDKLNYLFNQVNAKVARSAENAGDTESAEETAE